MIKIEVEIAILVDKLKRNASCSLVEFKNVIKENNFEIKHLTYKYDEKIDILLELMLLWK